MSRPVTGGRDCPFAGPRASRPMAGSPRAGAAIRLLAPMTLSVPPSVLLFPSLASPSTLGSLRLAGCGGWS